MKKMDIFNFIFIILYVMGILVFYNVDYIKNNIIFFQITGIILLIIMFIDLFKSIKFNTYKMDNPNPSKINLLFLAILVYSCLYIPYAILNPLLNIVYLSFAGYIFYFIWIIFNGLFVYKLVSDYNEKGLKMFGKQDNYNEVDVIAYQIKQLDDKQKIITAKNRIIVFNSSGVYEFVVYNSSGSLKGNIIEDVWYSNNREIKNPFVLRKNANNFIVTRTNVNYDIKGVRLISKSSIKTFIENSLIQQIYSEDQILKMYESVCKKFSINN